MKNPDGDYGLAGGRACVPGSMVLDSSIQVDQFCLFSQIQEQD